MNGLNEEQQVPTQSASPIFTQNQLQVVEAVWQTADSSFRIKRFVINLSAADRNSLIMLIISTSESIAINLNIVMYIYLLTDSALLVEYEPYFVTKPLFL